MPLYDYDCADCGRRFEVVHGVHADGPTPARSAAAARAQGDHAPAVHFKGSGWAKKERRDDGPSGAAKDGGGERWITTTARRASAAAPADDDGRGVPEEVQDAVERTAPDGGRVEAEEADEPSTPASTTPTDRWPPRRLDHARRGSRDPGRRQRPLHAVDDRRLGAGGPSAEHQARWAAVRPAGRGPGPGRAPRRVRLEDVQPVLFEDLGG